MRAIQVSNPGIGLWPDWDKLRAIKPDPPTRIYFVTGDIDPVRDRQCRRFVTKAYREGVLSQGFEYGLVWDPFWHGWTPQQLVEHMEADLKAVGIPPTGQPGATTPLPCRADIEFPRRDRYVPIWRRLWRKVRPQRETMWSLEPGQGGWIKQVPGFVDELNGDPNLTVSGQGYLGDPNMAPVSERSVIDDLAEAGIRRERLVYEYDAARIKLEADDKWWMPAGWNGVIYSYDRLAA